MRQTWVTVTPNLSTRGPHDWNGWTYLLVLYLLVSILFYESRFFTEFQTWWIDFFFNVTRAFLCTCLKRLYVSYGFDIISVSLFPLVYWFLVIICTLIISLISNPSSENRFFVSIYTDLLEFSLWYDFLWLFLGSLRETRHWYHHVVAKWEREYLIRKRYLNFEGKSVIHTKWDKRLDPFNHFTRIIRINTSKYV